MKFLKYLLFLILILIIGIAIYVAVQPNTYDFSRSRVIKAPASMLYNKVNDYKNWKEFSPWIEQEPNATLTYDNKTKGIDGGYSWSGKILGEGNMKTTGITPNKSIAQDINFIKPFEGGAKINWSFEPSPDGTKVTWAMNGEQDFMTKAFTAFMGTIEKTTGPQFERGLIKLDSVTLQDMKKYSIKTQGITEHGGGFYLYNTSSCKISDLPTKMAEMMPKLTAYAKKNNITMAGSPYVLYHKVDNENGTAMFSCCIPTEARVITTEKDILSGELKPFSALQITLKGNYTNLKEAWEKAMQHISKNNIEQIKDGVMLESYATDPSNTPNPADYLTNIYIAVKK